MQTDNKSVKDSGNIDITTFYIDDDEFLKQSRSKRTVEIKLDRAPSINDPIKSKENYNDTRTKSETIDIVSNIKRGKKPDNSLARRGFVMQQPNNSSGSGQSSQDYSSNTEGESPTKHASWKADEYLNLEDYHLMRLTNTKPSADINLKVNANEKSAFLNQTSKNVLETNNGNKGVDENVNLKNPEDFYVDYPDRSKNDRKMLLLAKAQNQMKELEEDAGIEELNKKTEEYLNTKKSTQEVK